MFNTFDIKEEVRNLPTLPGVYLMKDADNKIIYVGKAKNLKNRVKSYFQKSTDHPKVTAMVEKIASFECIVTDTELEALVLECNLIKKHEPHYNILLRDDKSYYPYIRITIDEEYPTLSLARKVEKDGAKYFGPFYSSMVVNETIDIIEGIFPLKTCTKKLPAEVGRSRPCISHQIGRCVAPCQGGVNKEEYRGMMTDIIKFLNGRTEEIIDKLKNKMDEYSVNLEFEKAAETRDKIDIIKNKVSAKQKITSVQLENIDVIGIAQNETDACVQLFFIRGGKTIGRDFFILEGAGGNDIDEIISGFMKQFYEKAAFCPPLILLPHEIADMELMKKWLCEKYNSKVDLRTPQKGEKKEIVEMASKNADLQLKNFSIRFIGISQNELKTLEKFADTFSLEKVPARIEAYDISNTGMHEVVASMVVFENGKPDKKEYRRFNIKDKNNKGDLDKMREVIQRRLAHNEIKLPDVILADGGVLHENMVRRVLAIDGRDELKNIKVFGMVKDDKHRTRGLITDGREYDLKKDPDMLRFITYIQNEAHRFALAYNKNLRDKRYTSSKLDNIPGIGKTKKIALLKKFGSVSNIKKATKEELMELSGISAGIADNIIEGLKE